MPIVLLKNLDVRQQIDDTYFGTHPRPNLEKLRLILASNGLVVRRPDTASPHGAASVHEQPLPVPSASFHAVSYAEGLRSTSCVRASDGGTTRADREHDLLGREAFLCTTATPAPARKCGLAPRRTILTEYRSSELSSSWCSAS